MIGKIVLDLFGSGNNSYEFASRGVKIYCVDEELWQYHPLKNIIWLKLI